MDLFDNTKGLFNNKFRHICTTSQTLRLKEIVFAVLFKFPNKEIRTLKVCIPIKGKNDFFPKDKLVNFNVKIANRHLTELK